jgi:peptidoglycan hydrolase CwlO-like protein
MRKAALALLLVLVAIVALQGRTLFAKSSEDTDTAVLEQKLDQVLEKQDKILEELEYVKKQVDIIRVRASRR